MNWKY